MNGGSFALELPLHVLFFMSSAIINFAVLERILFVSIPAHITNDDSAQSPDPTGVDSRHAAHSLFRIFCSPSNEIA